MAIYYQITPSWSCVSHWVPAKDVTAAFDAVYEKVNFITDSHEISEDAASWCDLASVGDTYYGDDFTIEVVED